MPQAGRAEPSEQPLEVATLVGHRNLEMSLRCLGSLLRHSADPLRLRVHDDGTLTFGDRERLVANLVGTRIVRRSEADDRVGPTLAGHPAARRFRSSNVLALKLFDVFHFSGGRLQYCDSDILFLRPFRDLFHAEAAGAAALFMADWQNAYSLRSWHTLRFRRLRLPLRANTGVIQFNACELDLDLIEWYLSRPELAVTPVWMEQTAWSLLGFRAGCNIWDASQLRIPLTREADVDAVGLHFTSSSRHLLSGFHEAETAGQPEREPVVMRSTSAKRCGFVNLAIGEGVRRYRRIRAAASLRLRRSPPLRRHAADHPKSGCC